MRVSSLSNLDSSAAGGYAIWCGVDVGKSEHYACALDTTGKKVHDKPLPNDEAALVGVLTGLAGYDDDLAATSTRLTNRLHEALLHIHPALERLLGKHIRPWWVLELLAAAPTPARLSELDVTGMTEIMRTRSSRLAKTLPTKILAALDIQTVVGPGTTDFGRVIAGVAAQLREFPTAGHLPAYAGLAPRHPQVRILDQERDPVPARQPRLHERLFLSACASLADPTCRAYSDRKRVAGKRHNATLICLARRRVDVLFACCATARPISSRPPTSQPRSPWPLDSPIETPPGWSTPR